MVIQEIFYGNTELNKKDSLTTPEIASLTVKVCQIAQNAGDKILEIYNSDFSVNYKDDRSPLTAADMASHETISTRLRELTPEIPVLSEESANVPFEERKQWQTYWLIDPLDGTREFVKKNGEFTVNIALIYEHKPVSGIIYIPVSGILYFASRDNGAFKKYPDKSPEKIKTRKTDPDNLAVAGSRSHGSEKQFRFIRGLGNIEVIAIGSALKFCLVAEGKVDIYPRFGPTSEWDTAAAQCIVEEAGGTVTDLAFIPLTYNTKPSLINPDFLVIADPEYNWSENLPE